MALSPATIDFLADNGGRPALIEALRADLTESMRDRALRRAAELTAEWAPGSRDFDLAVWAGSASVILSELLATEV